MQFKDNRKENKFKFSELNEGTVFQVANSDRINMKTENISSGGGFYNTIELISGDLFYTEDNKIVTKLSVTIIIED